MNWCDIRNLASATIRRLDQQYVLKHDELLSGGDIRIKANAWVRCDFTDAKLAAVPRELRVREAVAWLARKKRLGL